MKIILFLLLIISFFNCSFVFCQQLPIQVERKVSFTTTEGSYMNVDISPDGKILLFDMVGEIFSLPVTGGRATQLTHGIALHLSPVWISNSQFIYISDDTGELRFHIRNIAGDYDSIADKAYLGLGMLHDTTIKHYISPNKRWHAYIKDTNKTKALIIADCISGQKRVLIPSLLKKPYSYSTTVANYHFCFSSDSKEIYIGYGGHIHSINVETGSDKIIPFSADVESDQGRFVYNTFPIKHDSIKVKYTRSANMSPDGSQIVFSALGKIYLQELSNNRAYPLIKQNAQQFQPVFSKDGSWIAYVTWNDSIGGHLWRVSKSGTQLQQLTQIPGHYERPAWSPDGKSIAVIRGDAKLGDRDDDGTGALEIVSLVDGNKKLVDDSIPLWNCLSFSNDGKRIIYQPKYRVEKKDSLGAMLISKNINGTDPVILLMGPEDKYVQQRVFSPDSKYLAYSSREDIYLVPLTSSTPQIISARSPNAIKLSPGVDPYWGKDGKVSWSYGNQFYNVDPEKVILLADSVVPDMKVELNIVESMSFARGTIVLKDARIITMKGDEVIHHGIIVIKDGRISNIGNFGSVCIPDEAKIFDLRGKTIMPGIIDLHLHMRVSPNIFPQQSWMFLANLAYGVTTARDPSLNFDSFGYKELLETGKMVGPRLFTVGRAARIPDGLIKCDDLDEARNLVNKRVIMGGTVVKQYMLDSRLQRQWLLMACRESKLNMTNEGLWDPIGQFAMIKDGSTGIEHNPVWGDVYNDVIKLYSKSGIYLTPALQAAYGAEGANQYFKLKYWHDYDEKVQRFIIKNLPENSTNNWNRRLINNKSRYQFSGSDSLFISPARVDAKMIKEGANIGLGSHGNTQGIGAHNEIWALRMGGITNLQALRAATLTGAKALGVAQDLGSLEPGKIADLIVLHKNPLDSIYNSRDIMYVMKDGILYDAETLDTVWPVAKSVQKGN